MSSARRATPSSSGPTRGCLGCGSGLIRALFSRCPTSTKTHKPGIQNQQTHKRCIRKVKLSWDKRVHVRTCPLRCSYSFARTYSTKATSLAKAGYQYESTRPKKNISKWPKSCQRSCRCCPSGLLGWLDSDRVASCCWSVPRRMLTLCSVSGCQTEVYPCMLPYKETVQGGDDATDMLALSCWFR